MSDQDRTLVQPIKTFDDAEHGMQHPASRPYSVSRLRAGELKANGLVDILQDPGSKAAAPPENKMAAAPLNKAVAPATIVKK